MPQLEKNFKEQYATVIDNQSKKDMYTKEATVQTPQSRPQLFSPLLKHNKFEKAPWGMWEFPLM